MSHSSLILCIKFKYIPLICITKFKFCQRRGSSYCFKNSMKFEFFISSKLKLQICLSFFKFKKLQKCFLYTLLYHYANFYNFVSMFPTSIERKKERRKKMKQFIFFLHPTLKISHFHGNNKIKSPLFCALFNTTT